ncbi:MAG: helix-turn-helix transcriptional regulator, partial [Agathobacter sp.]|nr:helix-turn-helix transcriptional regulator [Agathobacter sp.]
MTGYEFFRNARESRGYSAKTFAILMEISASNMYEYERGNRSFEVIPVYKAIQMFDEIGISLEEFFDTYYPYKTEIDERIKIWRQDNPREYQYQILKQRFMTRFSKMKARKILPQEKFDDLY